MDGLQIAAAPELAAYTFNSHRVVEMLRKWLVKFTDERRRTTSFSLSVTRGSGYGTPCWYCVLSISISIALVFALCLSVVSSPSLVSPSLPLGLSASSQRVI